MRASLAPGRPALLAGVLYVLAYLAVTVLLPRPVAAATRILLCGLWLAPPALLALVGHRAPSPQRAGDGARAVGLRLRVLRRSIPCGVALFFARGLETPPSAAGRRAFACSPTMARSCCWPRASSPGPTVRARAREMRAAAHQALSLTLCAAFLVAYFVLLAPRVSTRATFLIYSAEDLVLVLLAFVLAGRVAPPDNAPYLLLAPGLALSAAFALIGNWRYATGRYQPYGPLDVAWMIPYWTLVAAAASARVPWVSAAEPAAAARREGLATAIALVFPPLLDLLAPRPRSARRRDGPHPPRALHPRGARPARRPAPARRPSRGRAPCPGARGRPGSPELLRFASGAAHELNNPLMAIVVASELAVARGGPEAAAAGPAGGRARRRAHRCGASSSWPSGQGASSRADG